MKFLGAAVILAIVSVLLVSSGVTPVGHDLGPANAGPAPPAADAKPVVSRSDSEVQRSAEENPAKRDAFGLLLLLQMLGDGGRR
jgi:hypothetical protein